MKKTKQTVMDALLDKLTGEQAMEVVRRLANRKGVIAEAVAATAKGVLADVDIEAIGVEVFSVLDLIDVQDCWDRSGASRDGYKDEVDVATEIIEEELQPFFDQVDRYHELGMGEQELNYCMGVVLGTYQYVQESDSEFKNWCEDIPLHYADNLLNRWRKRTTEPSLHAAMDEFIRNRCSTWAKDLTRKKG